MAHPSPVAAVLEHAGATMVDRSGRAEPLHFGSAAGELAACSVAVGLAERADVELVELGGPLEAVEHATELLTGTTLAPGAALVRGGVIWCAPASDRLVVLVDGEPAAPVHAEVRAVAAGHPGLALRAWGPQAAACELLGPRTEAVLSALGVPAALCPAVQSVHLAGVPALVVRRSWPRALLLTSPADAVAAWTAVERAGLPHGLTCVGGEAAARFRFVEPSLR